VGAYFHRAEDLHFGTQPEASGEQHTDHGRINYLSATYPFVLWGRNMVVSANYQNLYDLNRQWTFPIALSSDRVRLDQTVEYDQTGSLNAWGLAYGIQILPSLSVGITANFWEDGLENSGWQQTVTQKGSGQIAGRPFLFDAYSIDDFSLSGLNFNLGLLWNITGQLTVGAVFKSPFTADLRHRSTFTSAIHFPNNPDKDMINSNTTVANEDLDFPMSYGLGLAYRFSDHLTLSFDLYRTHWNDFELKTTDGVKLSPISGKPASQSDIDATIQARLGAEYLIITDKFVIPLRAGLFYDPAPAENSPDDFYGFSLGSGIGWGRFIFDIAYQFRWGNDVNQSILESFDFSEDIREHTVYGSLIIHF
jgi:long-subunit fatty acid transport protein